MDGRNARRLAGATLAGVLLAAGSAPAAESPPPTVALDTGRASGEATADIAIYRGLPYAAPPVGLLRWRPPQRPASWSGVRPATAFGPSCPQQGSPGITDITRYGGAPEPTSEDCLTLNVWAPAHLQGRAPVMVWIHGGSGRMGSGALPYYDGAAFARDGVVLVTINYRLGHLGALSHPALTKEAGKGPVGAYAAMDQIAALQWVQRNIASFGGDPRNVTVFGESSGGISVLGLTVTPSARGLFQRAIVESGGGWFPPGSDRKKAEAAGVAVAVAAGAPANAGMAQLRALPARAVADAQAPTDVYPDRNLTPDDVTTGLYAGRHATVPLMIGVNSGEDSLLSVGDGMAKARALMKPGDVERARKLYGLGPREDDLAIRYTVRDALVTAPARWVAGRWSGHAPAYLYRFDHVDQAARGYRARASHGGEIFYVFQTLGRQPDDPVAPSSGDERLAAEMHARWIAFARTGNPNIRGAPEWPAYSRKTDPWMVFGPDRSGPQTRVLKPQLDAQEGKIAPLIFFMWLIAEVKGFFGIR